MKTNGSFLRWFLTSVLTQQLPTLVFLSSVRFDRCTIFSNGVRDHSKSIFSTCRRSVVSTIPASGDHHYHSGVQTSATPTQLNANNSNANRRSVATTGAAGTSLFTSATGGAVTAASANQSPSATKPDKGGTTSQAGGRLPVHEMRR
ncbi:unnamed protein product [Rodentolepis nana]|uniref:Secreted protein n=1 Tax=Rodentolepis nana TaxID=102285 RepID=A0A0R3TG06_RODNA|nr:unnamed protein product [Rodentolepis nana]